MSRKPITISRAGRSGSISLAAAGLTRERAPTVWITALRQVQNPNRAGLDIVALDENFGALKVSPFFYFSDAELDAYLARHDLSNEWDYFDPAKADEKRECGLHAAWGRNAVST